jgi:hypothetical protein
MLQLETLYSHLEYEYNEDLDYIDDIYNYLHIVRLLEEKNDEQLVLEKMELLEEGLFMKLKYDDIQISSLHKLLEKYNKEKNKLIENINKFLTQYNTTINELLEIHNELSLAKLQYKECKINLINTKLEHWWNWISNSIIKKIINFKQGDTSDDISKILICKKIFKLLNILNKIENIELYTYKLIIYDIKNYGKKHLYTYNSELLLHFYNYLNKMLEIKYNTLFTMEVDITENEEIVNFLIMNENMYYLDKNDNIIIVDIKDNIDLFYKLNMTYNLYKMLKLFLKEQYDTTQTIVLDSKIQEYLKLLNNIINELGNKKILELLHTNIDITNTTKNKYYIFVNYLNNIILSVFDTYMINLNNIVKQTLQNKHNCLKEFKKVYSQKI